MDCYLSKSSEKTTIIVLLVPKDIKIFCCYSGDYDFANDVYWENIGGSFIRGIN